MATTAGGQVRTVTVSLPFTGRWKVENSPARRVPSHGSHLLATTYAIDFVGVDERGRTAPGVSWRTALATEPPELYFAFGRPVLAPVSGHVVSVHEGEQDHAGRRSPLTLVPYMLGQAGRLRRGTAALAGNHVTIAATSPAGTDFVTVMHLRAGSTRVRVGQYVHEGARLADCGNSGNSTQPHVHLQAMDDADPRAARGLPLAFRAFDEQPARATEFTTRENAVPGEGSIVAPPH